MERSAVISDDGLYRYRLDRRWGDGPRALFVLLNPSTADADVDDPTLRRCIAFARSSGCSALTVVNLFAYRATKPRDMRAATDPVGPDADLHLVAAATGAGIVVAGWGRHGGWRPERVARVVELLHGNALMCLGVTKEGQPRHPLYVSGSVTPSPFSPVPATV